MKKDDLPTVNGWRPNFEETVRKRWAQGEPFDMTRLHMTDEVQVRINGVPVWMEVLDPPTPDLIRCFAHGLGVREFKPSEITMMRGPRPTGYAFEIEVKKLTDWWRNQTPLQREVFRDLGEA